MTSPDATTGTDAELQRTLDTLIKDLGGCGITDQQIALRLARTLAAKGVSTIDALPDQNDPAKVYELFAGLTPAERLEAGDLIARRNGHDTDNNGWPQWLHNLLAEVENGDRIAEARADLKAALAALADAHRHVERICATLTEEYDVEYVEGGSLTSLFRHHLDQAGISIETAQALNPVKDL